MMEQGFRGNCDSQGKLGMCPSLPKWIRVVFQEHGTGISLPAGSDQGYSPTPRQHF